ncbi:hypothetical protein M8J77_023623 [Diaphorina citri]|nr:hypothetical protein M8J77_023623 [Diaphorina citri]
MDDNIHITYTEKLMKYDDLKRQMKNMHQLDEVTVLPIIITTNGLVHKYTKINIEKLNIKNPSAISSRKHIRSTNNLVKEENSNSSKKKKKKKKKKKEEENTMKKKKEKKEERKIKEEEEKEKKKEKETKKKRKQEKEEEKKKKN